MIVSEEMSRQWVLKTFMNRKINRSNKDVETYLREQGIEWKWNCSNADVYIYKQFSGFSIGQLIANYKVAREKKKKNYIDIIAEPRFIAPYSYYFAEPLRTITYAPGEEYSNRFYFPSDWYEPKLEDWPKRKDKLVFIGRPMHHRIKAIKELINHGIEVDIYSREKWPLPGWKGCCESEWNTSQQYKYRLALENSYKHKYHSDKLFNGIRAGNVTFYGCDPCLDLPFAKKNVFVPFTIENVLSYFEDKSKSENIVENISTFLFTDDWEIYSFKNFFDTVMNVIKKL